MSETGDKKSRKELRKIVDAKDKQLADANLQIKAWKNKARIIENACFTIAVIVVCCAALFTLAAPFYQKMVSQDQYNELVVQKQRVEDELGQFNSMFTKRECNFVTFTGARIVTTSQTILEGGPIECKCGIDGICLTKNGWIDPSFPKGVGCTCANSAWKADGVPFYNVTDEASAPVHLRCSMHPDGRILRKSCVLRVAESEPSVNMFVRVMKSNITYLIVLIIGNLFLCALAIVGISQEKKFYDARKKLNAPTPQLEKHVVAANTFSCAKVFDLASNECVPVEWVNLPVDCVRAALASTKKFVCFYRHGDLIYMVDSNEKQPDMTNYTIEYLRGVLSKHSETNPPTSRTVHILDIETNLPVEIAWKDLPEKCVDAIASSTDKHVRLCKHGDTIYLQPLEKFDSDDKTCFLVEELRCLRWFECVSRPGSSDVPLGKMKILDSRIDSNVEVDWRKHIDLLKKIVSNDNVQFVKFYITDDGRFLKGYLEDKSNRVVVELFDHVYYSIEYLRAVVEHLKQ